MYFTEANYKNAIWELLNRSIQHSVLFDTLLLELMTREIIVW